MRFERRPEGSAGSVATRVLREDRLAAELSAAIEERQLVLHYQPVIDTRSGSVVAVEGLIRWRDPEQGTLGPAAFLDLAKRSGLIESIGHWAIEQACTDARSLHDGGHRVAVSVNLSDPELTAGLVDVVEDALDANGIDGRWLE